MGVRTCNHETSNRSLVVKPSTETKSVSHCGDTRASGRDSGDPTLCTADEWTVGSLLVKLVRALGGDFWPNQATKETKIVRVKILVIWAS